MKHSNCPGCQSEKTEDFFIMKNAPVQSLVTIKNKEEALSIAKKDISLSFCHGCGFIFNSSFDTSIDHYTHGYEDQQGFSPTFRKFITEVTNRFIEKHDVKNKDIIEIGCGKGDFIALITELGNNRGVGIDPAFVEERREPDPSLRFIKEFFSEKHRNLPKDVITCRHTLEHIHGTGEFMETIRNSIKKEEEKVILFFEVPSIVRILKIQAFWDIFYEHCSYFSPGSLGRLFRLKGFEVLDMYLEYDNQYLFIEARPGQNQIKSNQLEESVEDLWELTRDFTKNLSQNLLKWRLLLEQYKKEGKKVVVWGGGSKSVGFLTHFDNIGLIDHVIDINPHMSGNFIPGIGIQYKQPEFLKNYRPDVVIIMNGVYEKEIGKMLSDLDLYPTLHAL